MRGGLGNRNGFALVAALWLLVALGSVGLHAALASRARRQAAANLLDEVRARAAVVAGSEYARSRLTAAMLGRAEELRSEAMASARGSRQQRRAAQSSVRNLFRSANPLEDPWREPQDLMVSEMAFGDTRYALLLRDVGAALNLNDATEDMLRQFFALGLDVDFAEADQLAQAILDWRDEDDIPRINGGERGEYLDDEALVLPPNRDFVEIDELRHVRGMTPELYVMAAPAPHSHRRWRDQSQLGTRTRSPCRSGHGPGSGDADSSHAGFGVPSQKRQGARGPPAGGRDGHREHGPGVQQPNDLYHRPGGDPGPGLGGRRGRSGHITGGGVQREQRGDRGLAGDLLMAPRNGIRIGIALSDREAVAVILGGKGSPTARVSLSLDSNGTGAGTGMALEIQRGVAELKRELDKVSGRTTEGGMAFVGLLPPLADARLVSLPPMRRGEVEAVLGRDVARYFLGANRPRIVGVRLPRGNRSRIGKPSGAPAYVLAAAAPLGLLEATRSALVGVGWRCASFSAAYGSWLQSAVSLKRTPVDSILALVGPTVHVLRLNGGDPVGVRQLPASDPVEAVKAIGAGPGRVLVLASPQQFEGFRGPLVAAGLSPVRDPEGWLGAEELTAARAPAAELELVPPALASERRAEVRRTSRALAAGTAVLVIAALGAQLWGAHRELRGVQEQRAAIRSEVEPLLLARDSLNDLTTQVESMAELSSSSPVWTRSLVELSALLPMDTYLTGFFASGDTVELEAAGAQAGEAIQALREAGLFEEIRLQGLVERELEDGETVVERFRLWARLPPGGKGGEGS